MISRRSSLAELAWWVVLVVLAGIVCLTFATPAP